MPPGRMPAMGMAPRVASRPAPQATAPAAVDSKLVATIAKAREAYWKGDYSAAAAIYRNVTQAQPDNPDILGEYGNLLLREGKTREAAEMYEKAAHLLIEQKRFRELHPLIGFIGSVDREAAAKLMEKLRAAR